MDQTTHIVYVVGTGSSWRNNELRFSLRSIERFLPGEKEVYLVGHLPPDLTGINHIPAKDVEKHPILNVNFKLLQAARELRHLGRFLFFNDDFWLSSRWDAPHPHYYQGTLQDVIDRFARTDENYYRKSLLETRQSLLNEYSLEPRNFEIHCPIEFSPTRLEEVLVNPIGGPAKLVRTVYCSTTSGILMKSIVDYKLRRAWKAPPAGTPCVSADDFVVHGRWAKHWLMKMFPEPSKYETEELVL